MKMTYLSMKDRLEKGNAYELLGYDFMVVGT